MVRPSLLEKDHPLCRYIISCRQAVEVDTACNIACFPHDRVSSRLEISINQHHDALFRYVENFESGMRWIRQCETQFCARVERVREVCGKIELRGQILLTRFNGQVQVQLD